MRDDTSVNPGLTTIMPDRLRQYDGDCIWQAHWGRERNRWVAWWRSRLGIGWWMEVKEWK